MHHQFENMTMAYSNRFVVFLIATALIVTSGLLSANPLPKGIKGIDHRIRVNGTSAPWQAIGRLHLSGRGFCTGVLVKPGMVLTAAHCVWNRHTGKTLPPDALYFVAGYHKERFIASSVIRKVHLASGFKPDAKISLDAAEKDWALLELESPINNIRPLPLKSLSADELAGLGDKYPIVQAGFSRDSPYVLTVDDQCVIRLKISDKELIAHDCDAIRGDSGSPLMIHTKDGLRVIAIHSSNRYLKDGYALGLAIPSASVNKLPFPIALR